MSPGGRCQRDPGAEVPTARGGVRHLNPQRLVASLVPQRKCTNCLIEQATTRRVMCYSRAKMFSNGFVPVGYDRTVRRHAVKFVMSAGPQIACACLC
jgi:hypothetical protein